MSDERLGVEFDIDWSRFPKLAKTFEHRPLDNDHWKELMGLFRVVVMADRAVRMTPPDEPAPREVDVAALREALLEAFGLWYDAACTSDYGARSRLIDEAQVANERALALLAPERREPPGLPDGWTACRMAKGTDAQVYEREGDESEIVMWDHGGVEMYVEDPVTITELSAVLAHHLAARKAGA